MKIALAQLNYHIGNFSNNTTKIISAIEKAKSENANLIVFSELAIGGYPAKDLLRNNTFLESCSHSLEEIAEICKNITCIIGAPIPNKSTPGKPLHNAAVVIQNTKIEHFVFKSLLPDYDVFDEYRYFEPNQHVQCVTIDGSRIALTICEDLWNDSEQLYQNDIAQQLANEKPDVLINIAASPFSYTHFETRLKILKQNVLKMSCPVVYVNQIGAHTDLIFDGRSLAINKNGDIVEELNAFEEDLRFVELKDQQLKSIENPSLSNNNTHEIQLIHDALIFGIKDYFQKNNFQKAVLGLSGGIDSALVAALTARAIGGENVLAILMPSQYSSEHSIKDALDLVKNLGTQHQIIAINEIANSFDSSLKSFFSGKETDITEENIQARIRATLLMAASNKFGHILLNTSNKSEAAVGYGTLHGDMAGALSVIGDLYKTQVYDLAGYINKDEIIIPENTINKAPSAELRPDQKDSDSLPPYEILDSVLYHFIENEKSISQIVPLGFEEDLVKKIIQMVNRAEFKRFQSPPILRVSPKSFGAGRAFPLVAKYPEK